MSDIYQEAAEVAEVPTDIREMVVERVRDRTQGLVREVLAEYMHTECVIGNDGSSSVELAHFGARIEALGPDIT
jgi:hypothetical protein